MATRMQQRRGTAAQWTSSNPILNVAELGYETDTNKFKIGDGTNHWGDLDYFVDSNSTVNPAFGSSITFEGATANAYETTLAVTDPTADRTLTLPDSTGTVATQEYVDGAVSGASVDQSTLAGEGLDWNIATEAFDVNISLSNVSDITASASEVNYLVGVTSAIQDQLDNKLESADLSGYATESYVTTAIGNVIDSAPSALDTLNELAAALGDDENYASTITTALSGKVSLSTVDAAGDLLIGTADNTVGRLAIGTSGYLLTSNGTTAEWSAAPATGPTAVEIVMGVY